MSFLGKIKVDNSVPHPHFSFFFFKFHWFIKLQGKGITDLGQWSHMADQETESFKGKINSPGIDSQ